MISRLHVLALVGLSLAITAVALTTIGEPVSGAWLGIVGTVNAGVYVAYKVFNHFLWKIPTLQGWFVHRPHLYGTWDVELASFFESDGKRVESIKATAVITQSFTEIHLDFRSPESRGELLNGGIVKQPDGTYRFSGTYLNTPGLERQRSGNTTHKGSFWLVIEGKANKPTELRGSYWTERQTAGELVFRRS
jgi:hypothetical protein